VNKKEEMGKIGASKPVDPSVLQNPRALSVLQNP